MKIKPQEDNTYISNNENAKNDLINNIDHNINNNKEINIDRNIILESNHSPKFNQINYPTPTIKSCNIVMKTLAENGDLKNVTLFFNSLKSKYGFRPDGFSWFNLIQAAVTGKEMKESLNILNDFLLSRRDGTDAESISPNHIFNHLISAFQKNGDYDRVQELYEKMISNNMEPNIYTYTTLITAAYENNQADVADKYYQKILEKRLMMTHQFWRVLISPLSQKSDHTGIEHILQRMRLHGFVPHVTMWRDLIGIYGKLGLCKLCLKSLEIMVKEDNIKPDFSCYLRVIRAYSESENNWEKGLLLLRKARDLKLIVNPIAWQYIIEACINSTYLNQINNKYNNDIDHDNNDINIDNINFIEKNKINNYNNNKNNKINKNQKKNTRISNVFSLLHEMETVDKFLPDPYLWNTIVEAFGMRVYNPSMNNNNKKNSDIIIDSNNNNNNNNNNDNNNHNGFTHDYDNFDENNNYYNFRNKKNVKNSSLTRTTEEKDILFTNKNSKYFSYFYGDYDQDRLPEEISLLKRFLLICSDANQEKVFSELLRPLHKVSTSVGMYVQYSNYFIYLFLFIFLFSDL